MNCGGCTLCCKLIDVPWMKSPAGEYCTKCTAGVGCQIFKKADKRCKEYQCLYNQMKKVSINLRPDKCGVIFEKLNDNIIIGLSQSPVGFLNNDVKKQMASFNKEGLSVSMSIFGNPVPAILPASGVSAKAVYNEVREHLSKRKWQ